MIEILNRKDYLFNPATIGGFKVNRIALGEFKDLPNVLSGYALIDDNWEFILWDYLGQHIVDSNGIHYPHKLDLVSIPQY